MRSEKAETIQGIVSRDQEFGMYYKYNDKLLKVWGSILTYILEV